jgi:Domain of unknown function (DUF4189)
MLKRVLWAAMSATLALSAGPAAPHGALAIGVPESVVLDGISVGFSWNAASPEAARVEAMKSCLDLNTASLKARALCNIVSTFRQRCFSVAMDHPGGGGWGWALDASVQGAEAKALESCKSTVQKRCVVAFAQCDVMP